MLASMWCIRTLVLTQSYLGRNTIISIRQISLSYDWSSSSSSCRAASIDIPDPLSPLLPIVHRLWPVFRSTSRILTELLYVCSSWSSCLCSSMRRGQQVVLLLPGHMRGSIGAHHLWACPCFSSSVLHVWFD